MEALRIERSEEMEVQETEIQSEESPVGEHKSSGEVEIATQHLQVQIRTMRLALQ